MNTMMNRLSGTALLFLLMMGSAWAAPDPNTGTVTITGTLTEASCRVDNQSITLLTTPTSLFSTVGDTAGRKAFNFTLTGCTGSFANVGLHFVYNGSNINPATGCLINSVTATATNVEVCLLSNTLEKVNLYTNKLTQAGTDYTVAKGVGVTTITYYAEYTATGSVGAGSVETHSNFNLFYN